MTTTACSRFRWIAYCAALSGLCFGCAHLDPYENITAARDPAFDATSVYPDLTPRAAAAASMPEPLDATIRFLGSVPDEIARSEVRRRALLQSLKQMSDERTAYNGFVSVLTPAMVYTLVDPGIAHGDTQHFLVGGVASLAAWNLSLSARTTDPPGLYQRAIGRIACLEIEYGRYLYTDQELPGFDAWRDARRNGRSAPVARRMPDAADADRWELDFEQSLRAYEQEARKLVAALRELTDGGHSAVCAVRPSADCNRRDAVLGRAGIDRDEEARVILQDVEAVNSYARKLRGRVLGLYAKVDHEGAMALHASTASVMEDLRAGLQSHQAPLASVLASLDAVSAQVQEAAASAASAASAIQAVLAASQAASGTGTSNSSAKANSGRRSDRPARKVSSSRDVDLELPDRLRREFLDPGRRVDYGAAISAFRDTLTRFREAESGLRHALQDLEDLMEDQDARAGRATALAHKVGCYPKAAAPPASAATDATASTQVPLASTSTTIR